MDVAGLLHARGIELATLGGAYLVLLSTAIVTAAAFAAARHLLVVSPNRGARDYGVYGSVALAAVLVAIALENELLPAGAGALHYVAVPHVLVLLALHAAIWRKPEPWLVSLGAAAAAATVAVGTVLGLATSLVGTPYWIAFVLLGCLLAFLWRQAISTQRGFMSARSIYVDSKESRGKAVAPQQPWLGLPQWVALVSASAALAAANSVLRGRGIEEIPAAEIAGESGLLLALTLAICAVPAASYWLTRKAWLPELTRLVWLTWIVVGFALTYGNYLGSLTRA